MRIIDFHIKSEDRRYFISRKKKQFDDESNDGLQKKE
jgi:hypothetical protein